MPTISADFHSPPPPITSNAALDTQLVLASTPSSTQAAVQQAFDGIFSLCGFDSTVPDSFSLTSQVVTSQLAYNNGSYPGLTEANVVTALNNLSTAWSLPSYAQTSDVEVRQLHVALLVEFPQFLLSDATSRLNPTTGSYTAIRTTLSPLEVTLLFSMLLHQKLSNPQYQMTPTEFNTYWTALHSGTFLPSLQDRTAAINSAVQASISSAGSFTLYSQALQAMNDLGVIGGAQ